MILLRDDGVSYQGGRSRAVRNCWIHDLFLKIGPIGFPNVLDMRNLSQG